MYESDFLAQDNSLEQKRSTYEFMKIPNYSTEFETVEQPDRTGLCIPCSTAMGLKYLHNVGKLSIDRSQRNMMTMRDTLADCMRTVNTGTSDDNAQQGIIDYSYQYISKDVSFGSSFYCEDYEYADVQNEIDKGSLL